MSNMQRVDLLMRELKTFTSYESEICIGVVSNEYIQISRWFSETLGYGDMMNWQKKQSTTITTKTISSSGIWDYNALQYARFCSPDSQHLEIIIIIKRWRLLEARMLWVKANASKPNSPQSSTNDGISTGKYTNLLSITYFLIQLFPFSCECISFFLQSR